MAEQSHSQPTVGMYYLVFAALIALTALTVGVSLIPLAPALHLVIGLTIASAKAGLVILIFMHVYYSSRLTWVVALGSLLWLGILIGYTITDYLSRGWVSATGLK
jgi:cytochrome c oxidase subunit 4